MNYHIAVVSYKRYEILKDRTLKTLAQLGVNKKRINIFVASEDELTKYKDICGDEYNYVVGVAGIGGQRRFVNTYFAEGEKVFCVDDDIRSVMIKGEKKLQPVDLTLDQIVEIGYGWCEKTGARLWGVNHTFNNFYLKDEISFGLKYILGTFMGTYSHDWIWQDSDRPIVNTGEDHHTSLRAFVKYGNVVRFEYICLDTEALPGGNAQATLERDGVPRMVKHLENLTEVQKRYSDLCSLKFAKDTGNPTLRFKPVTVMKVSREEAGNWNIK